MAKLWPPCGHASGATLSDVRAAEATEAIAVEVFPRCECSGQLVSMTVINRARNQLRAHRPTCSADSAAKRSRKRGPTACIALPRDGRTMAQADLIAPDLTNTGKYPPSSCCCHLAQTTRPNRQAGRIRRTAAIGAFHVFRCGACRSAGPVRLTPTSTPADTRRPSTPQHPHPHRRHASARSPLAASPPATTEAR